VHFDHVALVEGIVGVVDEVVRVVCEVLPEDEAKC